MRKRVSLERLITLSVVVIGLFFGATGLAYTYWHAKDTRRQIVGLMFQELARQSAENVGLLLTKEIEWVEQLGALPVVHTAARQGARLSFENPDLRRVRESQQRYFTSMVIVDREGQAVGGVTSDVTRTHYKHQPWWSVVFEQGQPWGGDLNRDETGRWYWEVVVPIREAERGVVGALKVIIGRDDLLVSILGSRIGRTGHVMLLDEAGTVLACALLEPSRHRRFLGLGPEGVSRGTRMPTEAAWGEVGTDTHEGRDAIVGFAPVRLRSGIVSQRHWMLLVQQDPYETYEPLVTLTSRLALFGLVGLGFIAVLRWRLARRIAQPINALARRVRTWGPPHESAPGDAAEAVGIEEIDTLAASFEDLSVRLHRASQESQQYVCQLEDANREIARSEEHYRKVWNHSLHLMLLVDSAGIIRDLNRRGEIKLWRPAAGLLGTQVSSLFRVEDQPRLHELLADVFATGKEQAAGEWSLPSPTGDFFVMEVDLVPLEKYGQVEAVMIQLTDWTEKKELQEQLLRSERLASLSQFASMFAHDIRNPLAGIKKTLELMGQRTELQGEPIRGWCEDLRFTIELLQGMINDLLDVYQEHYSGLPLMTSSCALSEVVHEVTRLFRVEAAARGITFDLHLSDKEIEIQVDRRRFERVLINLVHNATKFSPSGGTITLTSQRGGSKTLSFEGTTDRLPDDRVTLLVEDQGPGIDAHELPHIFELFFRHQGGQDWRIGRGLGLYFCRLVVEAHHGRIHAANRPEGGAAFTVELPIREVSHVHHTAHC